MRRNSVILLYRLIKQTEYKSNVQRECITNQPGVQTKMLRSYVLKLFPVDVTIQIAGI